MPTLESRTMFVSGKFYARLLVEESLGRTLTRDEVVHHIDGDPSNDVLSNLEVMTRSEHASIHKKGNTYRLGMHNSAEQRLRSSISHTGQIASPEKLENMRRANLGKTLSKETKAKISASLVGRPCSEETRRRIADTLQSTREIDKMTWSREVIEEAMKGESYV